MERILLYLGIFIGIVTAIGLYGYRRGHQAGEAEVQTLWDADKEAARKAHDELVQKLAKQEAVHAADQEEISLHLAQARNALDLALASQRSVYEQRLLQSSRRSEVYRSQAEAGTASCRDLASHAAELDRALEEGRGLVGELRETLGLRDRQVILLGQQIMDDRRLFEGGGSQ